MCSWVPPSDSRRWLRPVYQRPASRLCLITDLSSDCLLPLTAFDKNFYPNNRVLIQIFASLGDTSRHIEDTSGIDLSWLPPSWDHSARHGVSYNWPVSERFIPWFLKQQMALKWRASKSVTVLLLLICTRQNFQLSTWCQISCIKCKMCNVIWLN